MIDKADQNHRNVNEVSFSTERKTVKNKLGIAREA